MAADSSDLETMVRSLVIEGITDSLSRHLQSGNCIGYKFKDGGQSRIDSMQSAIEAGGFDFWYLTVQIDMRPGVILGQDSIEPPTIMTWIPIGYGGGIKQRIKFSHKTMKTRERYVIQILNPQVPGYLFAPFVYQKPNVNDYNTFKGCRETCEVEHLSPSSLGVYEWWQTFTCVVCGKIYLCECFRTAVEQHALSVNPLPASQKGTMIRNFLATIECAVYLPEICHLCTGTVSDLFFCHPMYGSQIMVRYGAYIQKTAIERNISERDAENHVRDIIGSPHIGEGWVNETQLYRLVKSVLPDHEVMREATPDWLGKLRLDIFVPSLNLAIEYQGEQHFRPIELFGGESGFQRTLQRDVRKKRLCKENGVKLLYFKYNEVLSKATVAEKLNSIIQQ